MIQLIAEAKQAFYEDKLTVAHAFEIARLQPLCGACENEALDMEPAVFSTLPFFEGHITTGWSGWGAFGVQPAVQE
ncbi:MAG: hypothetical protein DMG96_28015 [Acidobacteria bacterium]|nr:MAG: hypothetical protein DMG98_12670 [Acidobacteriota bacterium]PYV71810.1 MAG: hypothetical protein DMG96_28015 [Acidobacteriota bacterium]